MEINISSSIPIYIQVANWIEEQVMIGCIAEETQIPSTNQLADKYKITPATARKGYNLLEDKGILYKKRGAGFYVMKGARKKISAERKNRLYSKTLPAVITEAKKLDISPHELFDLIRDE